MAAELAGLIVLIVLIPILYFLIFRNVPNDRVGIVEKRWSASGSVREGIIAMNNEAGYAPDLMRGGIHTLSRLQYSLHIVPLVTIPNGSIGYIFSRDGIPLGPTQVLASNVTATDFQNVRHFLTNGGQRGPQRQILREGTYAINLAQFIVITREKVCSLKLSNDENGIFNEMMELIHQRGGFTPMVIKGSDDNVGVVTVQEGPSLPQNEIIAPIVGAVPEDSHYHSNFQDPEAFLQGGGFKGRQLQVLVEGTYYINRLFATVEVIPKTVIDVGYVGVVVFYTGKQTGDVSGKDYRHGELVEPGSRGVWNAPILPGKYAFNTFAGKVIPVPTTNIILKWSRSEVGSHRYDENLAEISLITKDAFEPSLPLSVVLHIDYQKAPLVIQRFGDIKRLVEQTLDPMIGAYFKNIGQTRTLIQLLQDRAGIQKAAVEDMKGRFAFYNLELQEVLIGTPKSGGDVHIETILEQLRVRQIAIEKLETYERQQTAAVKERELREAESRAEQQRIITQSELNIAIQTNEGKASYQRAVQQASQITALAEAEAQKVRLMAEAEAEKAARIGVAQAIAIEEQVHAYGGPRFQLTQQVMNRFSEAIQEGHVDVVPRVMLGGGGQGNGSVMESLLTLLLSDQLADNYSKSSTSGSKVDTDARSDMVKEIRGNIKSALAAPKKITN